MDDAPRIPTGERIYAIGDIHGRVDLFEELIGYIRQDNDARASARISLILLGDLVDRGPASAEVVRRCMALHGRTARLVVLKGNHEAMMIQAIAGDFLAFSVWLRSGGDAALASWGVDEALVAEGASPTLLSAARRSIPAQTLEWLRQLPLKHQVGDYLFVHAGIRPQIDIARQREQDLLWIRHEFLDSEARHPHMVVHGHSVSEAVEARPNRIGIDTGAYRTGVLTALGLEADRRWTLATMR